MTTRKLMPLGIAALVAATLTGCAPSVTPLQAAATECKSAEVLDDGQALAFDMEGDESGSGNGTLEDAACLLHTLDAPDVLVNKMSSTRALDGTQSDTFGDYEITWSYHPDAGLDFIIEVAS